MEMRHVYFGSVSSVSGQLTTATAFEHGQLDNQKASSVLGKKSTPVYLQILGDIK